MAKRKKLDSEENEDDVIFTPPDFDENEYLKNEVNKGKMLIFTFILAVIIGIVSGYMHVYGQASLAVVITFGILFTISSIFEKFKIEKPIDKKGWMSMIGVYFFTWLIFWIIVLNPPFNDLSAPQIELAQDNNTGAVLDYYYVEYKNDTDINDTWHVAQYQHGDYNVAANTTVVRFIITDNVAVDKVTINGNITQPVENYYYEYPISENTILIVSATDTSGNELYTRPGLTINIE